MRGGSKKRVLPAAADFMRISTTMIVFILLIAFHIPTFCSMVLYILLIFATTIKLSKVGVVQNEENFECLNDMNLRNTGTSSIIEVNEIYLVREIPVPSLLNEEISSSERNLSVEKNDKSMQEQISALRSLKTNLVVFFAGVITAFIIYLFPIRYQEQLNLILSSLQKLLFPLLTTVANFGTIRTVMKLFLTNVCSRGQVISLIWH
jgi:hypothetical protein